MYVIILSIFFLMFLVFENPFLNAQITEQTTLTILITFFGAINLFFCCWITFFIIKIEKSMSIKPNYKVEK